MKWQTAVAFGSGILVALALVSFITVYKIGPRWFWSSDVCPDPYITCGVLPLGTVLSGMVGTVVTIGVGTVLHKKTVGEMGETA